MGVALALALAGAGIAGAATALPRDYSVATHSSLYTGVDYDKIVKAAGPVTAHVTHIEPGAPVDLRVVSAHDKVPIRNSELEATSAMCKRTQCVVAVNGDFHNQGQPVGGVVMGGRMVRSPDPSRTQLNVDAAGRLSAGGFPWSGALVEGDGSQVPLAGVNVPARDGAVLYTPDWGTTTPAPGVELVLQTPTPLGQLNQAASVAFVGVRQGPGAIAAGTAVLSVPPTRADLLNTVWAKVLQGTAPAHGQVLVSSPTNAVESLGATPQLLRDGQPLLPFAADPNLVNFPQPRTLLGWNSAGDTFMVVVDGRQGASNGLTLAQAADLMLGLGATDAVNFDGGGGSTIVVGGTVWNQPSDQPNADPAVAERVAANAFMVMTRPGGAPAPQNPPRPGPSGAGSTPPTTAPPARGGVIAGPPAPPAGPPAPSPRPGAPTGSPLPGPGQTIVWPASPTSSPLSPSLFDTGSFPIALPSGGGGLLASSPLTCVTGGLGGQHRNIGTLALSGGATPAILASDGAADGAGTAAAAPADATGSGSSADRPKRTHDLRQTTAALGPALGLTTAVDEVPSLLRLPGRMPGGLIALQWAFFGAFWFLRRPLARRIRRPRRWSPSGAVVHLAVPRLPRWRTVMAAMAATLNSNL